VSSFWNCIRCETANPVTITSCEVCGFQRCYTTEEVEKLLQVKNAVDTVFVSTEVRLPGFANWWNTLPTAFRQAIELSIKEYCAPELIVEKMLPSLKTLHLQGSPRSRVPISELPYFFVFDRLTRLNCSYTEIKSLAVIEKMQSLTALHCAGCPIDSLAPLKNIPELQTLNCSYTLIPDLKPLAAVAGLKRLDCSNTPITSLQGLEPLTKLSVLWCNQTAISDLEPLKNCISLQKLYCFDTYITSLEPLLGLNSLQTLGLSRTKISATALAAFRKHKPDCQILY
jgi:hypothetical protein